MVGRRRWLPARRRRRACPRSPARDWTRCATRIVAALTAREDLRDPPAISNVRHLALVEDARDVGGARRAGARARRDRGAGAGRSRRRARARSRRSRAAARRTICCIHIFSEVLHRQVIWRSSRHVRTVDFDVIVIGAGHAGCEAAWAAARMGCRVGLVHAVGRDRRADAVQSGDRRHREGPPGSRDRRARRPDGPRDRRDGHPVQAAQPQPRAGGLVAARAGRQARVRRVGARGAVGRSPNITWLFGAPARILRRRRSRHRPGVRGRRRRRRARRSSSRPARSSTASCTSATSSGPRAARASRRRASWPSRCAAAASRWAG